MITRIEIDGFKSLRKFVLDLEPLTAIVGPNGAGKSNVLDALALLSRLARMDVTNALKGGRGRIDDQFARDAKGGVANEMTFAIESLLPPPIKGRKLPFNRVRYQVRLKRQALSGGAVEIAPADEQIAGILAEHDTWVGRHKRYGVFVRATKTIHARFLPPIAASAETNLSAAQSLVGLFPWDRMVLAALKRELGAMRFSHLDAVKLRGPSERAASAELEPDGSNLPSVLAQMPPASMAQIRSDLVDLVPGVRTVETRVVDDQFQLEFEFTDGQRLPARSVSDGTLRVLALLALLRAPAPSPLIGIEEPENGIYPGRLRALIDKLRDASEPHDEPVAGLWPQVILTSHSPILLSALRDHPACLVFADTVRGSSGRVTRVRRMGSTRARNVDPDTVSPGEVDRLLSLVEPTGSG